MKKIALAMLVVGSGLAMAKEGVRPGPSPVDLDSEGYGLCETCPVFKARFSEGGRGAEIRGSASSGFVMNQIPAPYPAGQICTSINQVGAGVPVEFLSGTFETGANTDVELIVNAEGRLARREGLPTDGTVGMGNLVLRLQVWPASQSDPPVQINPTPADVYTRFVMQSSLRDGYILTANPTNRHQPAVVPISISRILQGLSPNTVYKFRALSWWGVGSTGMVLDSVSVAQSGGPRGATMCTPVVSVKQFRP